MKRIRREIIPDDIYSVVSYNIVKYRKAVGLSAEELSERVGISHEYM